MDSSSVGGCISPSSCLNPVAVVKIAIEQGAASILRPIGSPA